MGTYEKPDLILDKSMGIAAKAIKDSTDKGLATIEAEKERRSKLAVAKAKEDERAKIRLDKQKAALVQKRVDDIADINKSITTSFKPQATQGKLVVKKNNGITTVTSEIIDANDPSVNNVDSELGMQDLWVATLEEMTKDLEQIQWGTPEYKKLEGDIGSLIELGGIGNQMMNSGVQTYEDSFIYDATTQKLVPKTYAANGASIYGQDSMKQNLAIAWSNGGKDPISGKMAVSYVVQGKNVGVKYIDPVIADQQKGLKKGDNGYVDPKEYTYFQNFLPKAKGAQKGHQFWDVVDVDAFNKDLSRVWNQNDAGYNATITSIESKADDEITVETVKNYDKANQDIRDKMTSPDNVANLNITPNTWQMIRKDSDPKVWKRNDEMQQIAAERMADKAISQFGKELSVTKRRRLEEMRTKADKQIQNKALNEGFGGLSSFATYSNFWDNSNLQGTKDVNNVDFGAQGRKYTIQELDKMSRYISNKGQVGQRVLVDILNRTGGRGGMKKYISGAKLKRDKADEFVNQYNVAKGTALVSGAMSTGEQGDVIKWATDQVDNNGNPLLNPGYNGLKTTSVYDAANVKKEFTSDNEEQILRILLDQFVTPTQTQKVLDVRPTVGDSKYIAVNEDDFNADDASQNFA